MTLVSMIYSHGVPVIVTDRAISQKGNTEPVLLPTTNAYTMKPTPVVGFNVKSIIIKDILCVAFSGVVSVIEELLSEIKDYFLYREVNHLNLKQLHDSLDFQGCSVLFSLGGEAMDGNILVLKVGAWAESQERVNLDVHSCGSGADTWNKYLVEHMAYVDDSELTIEYIMQYVLSSCMAFLNHERKYKEYLRDGWGGGFDLIFYTGSIFKRLDNVVYAFHKIDISQPGYPMPVSLIHNTYKENTAICRNFTAEGYGIFVVPEFNNKLPREEENPDFTCENIISCIHIFNDKEHLHDLSVMFWDYNKNAEPPAYTRKLNGKYGVQFRKEYDEQIVKAYKEFLL